MPPNQGVAAEFGAELWGLFELQAQRKQQKSSLELLPADSWALSRALVSARRAGERRGGGKPKTPAIWLINIYSEVTNALLDKTELAEEGLRGSDDGVCFWRKVCSGDVETSS